GTEHVGHLPTRCSSSVIHNDLVFIVMVQYYGDITRPLVTQPLSNRQKKTENAKPGQKIAGRLCSRLFYDR
ncbi:hypothetical protein ABG835_13340, partial [Phocaeicola vulgatus]|nr:hypothetical protein [Phocaeicola vulgatus]MDC1714415.1 hypothetical protein [Phocaeicola vulgatus]